MPTLVPALPTPSEIATVTVGDAVSATSVGRVWSSQIAFLLGRAVNQPLSTRFHEVNRTTTALVIPIQWRPSPGCRLARLRVDLGVTTFVTVNGRAVATDADSTLNLAVATGMVRVDTANAFDGAALLGQQHPLVAARVAYACDISLGDAGDVPDQIHDLTLTIDDVAGAGHTGVTHVSLTELPVATLRPETGETGMLLPWCDPRNELHATATGGQGVPGFLDAEQAAAVGIREHIQLCTYEHTSYAWTRASATVGAIDWVGSIGTAVDPIFRVRVRAIHGNSSGNSATFTVRIRYLSTNTGTFRLVRDPVGLGVSSNHDVAVPSSGGVWAAHSDTVTLRTDGTDQYIDLKFHSATSDASAIYISSIALIQTETA